MNTTHYDLYVADYSATTEQREAAFLAAIFIVNQNENTFDN